MKSRAYLSLLLLALASLVSCNRDVAPLPEQKAIDTGGENDDTRGIDKVYERFREAYARLDPDRAAAVYTENALYLPPGEDILRGRNAIRANFERVYQSAAENGLNLDISFTFVDRSIEGDMAYDVGYYEVVRRSGEEAVSKTRGKFTVVLKRQPTGSWRFHVDGYSAVPSKEESELTGSGVKS